MLNKYLLLGLENIWKTASLLIIFLAIPTSIILAILGLLNGNSFFVLVIGILIPIVPSWILQNGLVEQFSNIKDIGIFIIPIIGMFILSSYIEGIYLVLAWITFFVVCTLAFVAVRYIYMNFDKLVSRQMLYRNSEVAMLDTKWRYVFNRYSYIVLATIYTITVIVVYILLSTKQ